MRIAVISDIHGNMEALQEVFDDIENSGVDSIICLGDMVGYGPEPEAVHLRSLSRATDRLLVLYQEHSPLPGERDPDGST